MKLRTARFALILSCLPAIAMAVESTTVTTPAGGTHGSLASGNLPCATSHNQLGDCSPPLPAAHVTTDTNTQTLQNKSISGAQNTLTAIPTGALATPQGNGSKVQLSTGTTTNGDLVKYDANGNAIDSGTALSSLAPLASPSFTGTVTMPDGSTWTSSGLTNFDILQFAGVTVTNTGQDINDQKGTSWAFSGTPYNALAWELSKGTAGAPVSVGGPVFKLSKIESIVPGAGNAGCNSNNVDNTCNAALVVGDQGLSTDQMQVNAASFFASSAANGACGTNSCNAVAARFVSRVTGSGIYKSSAAQFLSENRSSSASAGLKGSEWDINNLSGFDCGTPNYTNAGNCDGALWLTTQGTNLPGPTIHIGVDPGSPGWNEGITINQNAIKNYSFNDQSSSTTSVNIAGSHATAAVNVASGAGNVNLNGNTLLNAGISGAQNTLSAIPTGALATPQGNGSKVQLSTGTTTNGDVVKYDASGNAIDSGTLLSALAPLASPSFSGTVTLPDGSTWASGGLTDAGTNTWAGLNTFNGGIGLPGTTNPTGSNFYRDSSDILHYVSSHYDAPLIGACWVGDCSHPYFQTPMSFAATESSSGQKPPIACGRQEYYSGAGAFTYCQNNQYFHGKGVNTTTTAAFASGSTTLTVVANASIAAGQSVFGPCVPNGDTVSSYSAGSLVLVSGLSCNIPSGTTLGFPNASNSAPQNLATVGQFTLYEYTTETSVGSVESTAINGYAARYSPSAMEVSGGNFNAQDYTGRKSSIAGAMLGMEVDGIASGPDDSLARFGLEIPISEEGPSIDGASDWDSGIRIRPKTANATSPNSIVIDKGVNITTMEGGAANGMYGSFVHGFLCDGGESTGCYDVLGGSLTFNTSGSASSGQANLTFALGTNINPGQIVSGSANIPAGTKVSSVYQCDSAPTLTGCGATTNATLVTLGANLIGTVANATALTFTGTLNDGSNFSAAFNDALANWTNTNGTGYLKAGSTNNSGTIFDLQGFGEDSTNTTGVAYADIKFDVQSNTHGSVAGNINLVPAGSGCVKLNGICTGTFATQNYATPPAIGGATANAGSFTTLSASSTVSGSGFSTYLASPPAIGGSAAAAGTFTTLAANSDFTSKAHVLSSGTPLTSGSVSFGAGAGTSPTLNSITGDDHKFNINFTTGTTPSASAVVATISFANTNGAYPSAPQCGVTAAGANSALEIARVYPTSTTTTVVLNVDSSALGASTLLTFNVTC